MTLRETDEGPFGTAYVVQPKHGGSIILNANSTLRTRGADPLSHPEAYVMRFTMASSSSSGWVVLSEEEMQEVVRAYLRLREDLEDSAYGNE
ncbi:hypothetical protein QEH42_gp193 [Microbacterium phage Pumpernickel]|uniref:Uncharacterized protein n=1 Tax=Microbacterium phage Pumpernickel TaxID=2885983 RepID=A0AAE8Y7D3_9CAUD|nr:hypothetical protein QEH42_gp193 [Microbacterium phage Pumpernickel]UDL16025.1 hypothetical protein SEA_PUMPERNICKEL_275 [Microbacterium phage Pumpernickel]